MRELRKDLLTNDAERVWLDKAEINIRDSLSNRIEGGTRLNRNIAVVLSRNSIDVPWVKNELAMNQEIASDEVIFLPLLREECELPEFLEGKPRADVSKHEDYEAALGKLLRKLRIKGRGTINTRRRCAWMGIATHVLVNWAASGVTELAVPWTRAPDRPRSARMVLSPDTRWRVQALRDRHRACPHG